MNDVFNFELCHDVPSFLFGCFFSKKIYFVAVALGVGSDQDVVRQRMPYQASASQCPFVPFAPCYPCTSIAFAGSKATTFDCRSDFSGTLVKKSFRASSKHPCSASVANSKICRAAAPSH